MPKVMFVNEVITVQAEAGKTLKEIADAAGVNLFEGFWADRFYRCRNDSGHCLGSGCRVWVTERSPGALSPRTVWERIRPTHSGTIRLACQAVVKGDVDVRTQPGALLETKPNPKWDPDTRHFKWQDRLKGQGGDEADDDSSTDE
jgi:ferredoxin